MFGSGKSCCVDARELGFLCEGVPVCSSGLTTFSVTMFGLGTMPGWSPPVARGIMVLFVKSGDFSLPKSASSFGGNLDGLLLEVINVPLANEGFNAVLFWWLTGC